MLRILRMVIGDLYSAARDRLYAHVREGGNRESSQSLSPVRRIRVRRRTWRTAADEAVEGAHNRGRGADGMPDRGRVGRLGWARRVDRLPFAWA